MPHSFRTSSVEETRAICDAFYHPVALTIRTAAEVLSFDLEVFRAGPLTFGEVAFGAEVGLGFEPLDAYHVTAPIAGRLESEQNGRSLTVLPGMAVAHQPEGQVLLRRVSGDCRMLCLKIERAALETELEELLGHPVQGPLRLAPMMDLTTGAGYSFGRVLRLLRAELGNHAGLLYEPLYANRLQNTILSGLLLTAEHQYRAELTAPARPSRPRTVKRAIDAMEAEPGHPFTTVRLAEIAGVSIRTLQEAFQQHVGISPMVYLRQVRLARAHLDLCAADPRQATVADVAHRWGFSHLGRFAAAYRSAYGDSPATTLRRPA